MLVIGEGQQPLRHVGSASRSLSGNQAEKVVFNGSPSEYFGPLSAKPGLFSAGEPASAFEGSSGVVAGTVLRRWDGNGGRRRWGPVSRVAGPVSSGKVAGPVPVAGNTQFCGAVSAYCGTEMDLSDTQFCGAFVAPVPSGAETEPNGAQAHGALSAAFETDLENAQFSGAVASPLRFETELEGAQFVDLVASSSGFETERKDVQFFEAEATKSGLVVASAGPLRSVDPGKGDAGHLGGRRRKGRAVVGAGTCQRAEAGLTPDDLFVSCRVEDPSSRVARVNTALHLNSYSTPTRSLHAAHNSHARMSHARCVVNSVGDTDDGGRLSCVYGGIKSLSTCTRTGVRRPAVEKLASPQQASLKLHDEMWAGLPMNLGPRIFREVEIVRGVQFVWLVLHVLITILSHLGQA